MHHIDIPVVVREGGIVPKQQTTHAAGFDLQADIPEGEVLTIYSGQKQLVSTGLSMAIPVGWEGQVRPRSGLAYKHGVTVLNSPGTIDSDYRGDIGVILINHSEMPVYINRGDRIAQLVFNEVPTVSFDIVKELPSTDRGTSGFGSTGTK